MPDIPENWRNIIQKIIEKLQLKISVDWSILESIIYSTQLRYKCNVIEIITKLLVDIICEHPFTDGNKRIAWIFAQLIIPELRQVSKERVIDTLLEIAQKCTESQEKLYEIVRKFIIDAVTQSLH